MREFLDEKFAKAARIAGHPYFILANLVACIALGVVAHNWWVWLAVWLDIVISIWTLELDLIIVNQNNRINDSNTLQLNALVRIEEKHTEMLQSIQDDITSIKIRLELPLEK